MPFSNSLWVCFGASVMIGSVTQSGVAGMTILQTDRTITAQVASSGTDGGTIPPTPGPWTFSATQGSVVRATTMQTLNASPTELRHSCTCETFYQSSDFFNIPARARSIFRVVFSLSQPTDWSVQADLSGSGNLLTAGFGLLTVPAMQVVPNIGNTGHYGGTLDPGQYEFYSNVIIESGLAGRNNGRWSLDVVFTVPSAGTASLLGIGMAGTRLRRRRG